MPTSLIIIFSSGYAQESCCWFYRVIVVESAKTSPVLCIVWLNLSFSIVTRVNRRQWFRSGEGLHRIYLYF